MPLVFAAFSFGRDRDLVSLLKEALAGTKVHDLRSDIDANRTWVCFSGESIAEPLIACCRLAFDRIDLTRHAGEFPRTGALDFCRFVDCTSDLIAEFTDTFIAQFNVPVFRADLSPEWAVVKDSGFGGVIDRVLHPDAGPPFAHPQWGVAGIERGNFALTVTVEIEEEFAHFCLSRERDIHERREDGDQDFFRVSAFGYPTPTYGSSRLFIEFCDPDAAPPDPVLEWLDRRAKVAGVAIRGVEVVGAVRKHDLLETRNIPVRAEQVYEHFEPLL